MLIAPPPWEALWVVTQWVAALVLVVVLAVVLVVVGLGLLVGILEFINPPPEESDEGEW